jgi:outer membrane autotransporter protein
LTSDAGMGVAAGDASEKFGVWGNALGGLAKQGSVKGDSAFKSNIAGGIVGADTMLE